MLSALDRTSVPTVARAELAFARRDGRTRLVQSETSPPLIVQRALYLDDALPDMAFVMLANPTAGVLGGDEQQVSVQVRAGARAHITTQAATKVLPGPGGCASLSTYLCIEDGGILEFLPDPLIPFAGTKLEQKTTITVVNGGTVIYGDILSPGRVAAGESLAYHSLRAVLAVKTPDGFPLYHEAFTFAPTASQSGLGVFGPLASPTLGSLLVVSPGTPAVGLRDLVRDALAAEPVYGAGATILPNNGGVAVRVLDNDTSTVQHAIRAAWAAARGLTLGVRLPPPRKH